MQRLKSLKRYISKSSVALSESKKKDEKLVEFFKFLKEYTKNLDLERTLSKPSSVSLLGLLAFASIKKYIELFMRHEQLPASGGRFLTHDDERALDQCGLIYLNLYDEQIQSANIEMIKRRYDRFLAEYMRVDPNEKENIFMGAVERVEMNRHSKELERLKANMVLQMKNHIIDLPYDQTINDDLFTSKLKSSSINIFLNTRIVRLYHLLRDTPKYNQIPWLFYDLLCFLKQSVQHSQNQTNLVPICVPNEWINCFSSEKLKNHRIE